MSWRAIQDSVGRSLSLAAVSDLAERLYWRTLACSNPYGRLEGHPKKVRALCFPILNVTDAAAGSAYLELLGVDRLVVYEVDGVAYLAIVDFERWQPKEAYKRRGESKIPAPPAKVEGQQELLARLWGVTPEQFGTTPEHSGTESGRFDEYPANGLQSRTLPDDSRTCRNLSGGDEKETRREREEKVQSSSLLVAREALLKALDDDDLDTVIRELRPNERQLSRILRAQAEERPRLEACLRAAIVRGHAVEPYLDELLQNGSWPEPIPDHQTLDADTTIDAALAWQRFIAGYAWDEYFTQDMILEEAETIRRSNRITGTLTDSDVLAAWRTARGTRYPQPAPEDNPL